MIPLAGKAAPNVLNSLGLLDGVIPAVSGFVRANIKGWGPAIDLLAVSSASGADTWASFVAVAPAAGDELGITVFS